LVESYLEYQLKPVAWSNSVLCSASHHTPVNWLRHPRNSIQLFLITAIELIQRHCWITLFYRTCALIPVLLMLGKGVRNPAAVNSIGMLSITFLIAAILF